MAGLVTVTSTPGTNAPLASLARPVMSLKGFSRVQLGPGETKTVRFTIGRDAFYNPSQEPLHSWVPAVGELYGIASSTPARAWPNMSTLDARTNTVTRRWQ